MQGRVTQSRVTVDGWPTLPRSTVSPRSGYAKLSTLTIPPEAREPLWIGRNRLRCDGGRGGSCCEGDDPWLAFRSGGIRRLSSVCSLLVIQDTTEGAAQCQHISRNSYTFFKSNYGKGTRLAPRHQHFPCELSHCWNLSVTETAQSVHPRGHPINHSTHIGFNVPPTFAPDLPLRS